MSKQYTCPMHPNIVSDVPGTCPLCGMNLVPKEGTASYTPSTTRAHSLAVSWKEYTPLIVIVVILLVASLIASGLNPQEFVRAFMAGFFLVFGAFKLMDLRGFVEGYTTYDLLAQKWTPYAYMYPFIELGFGLSMLGGYHPSWLLGAEFIVMVFSGVGVVIKLWKREPFMCACLGTFLKVPLTKVTVLENFGMAALTLILLWVTT